MSRFYNPGFKIEETLQFDNPVSEPNTGNISRHYVCIEKQSFADVPDTLTLDTPIGEFVVPVNFGSRLKHVHSSRGLIQIDPTRKNIAEEDNIAASDADAKSKGDAMWRNFLIDKATEWNSIVAETRAAGLFPKAATGFWKAVLNELHAEDPAAIVENQMKDREEGADMKRLLQEFGSMKAKLEALEKRKGQNA